VEQVTWTDADNFCQSLGGRLPTEAEWEYAARAGTDTIYICGDASSCLADIAWYQTNSGGSTNPVCQKTPNAWGLCDMSGDVEQWLNDWYAGNYYQESPTDNPPGADSGSFRVLRGGTWNDLPINLRASYRHFFNPNDSDIVSGFRCAKD
jgi:formylglycine-generating enzyme required for sulfatase activity